MHRWTQRLLERRYRAAWFAAIPFAIVVLALAAAEMAGWPFLAGPAQDALTRQLGVPVQIQAPFRLHLIGTPRLHVGRLQIAAAPPSTVPYLLDAQRVDLRWRWGDLWRFQHGETLRIAVLQADRLEAYLQRNQAGEASWRLTPRAAGAAASAPEPSPPFPQIDVLRVADGVVHVDDAPLRLSLEVKARVQESTTDASDGLFVSAQGRYRGTPASVSLQASAPLEAVADTTGAGHPLRLDVVAGASRLNFDGQIADLRGTRNFDGSLRLSGPSLADVGAPFGVTLPTTPPFSLRGRFSRADGVWRLAARDASIGSSHLAGEFSFDTRLKVPLLSGELRGSRLVLADLGPAIGAPLAAASAPGGSSVLPQREFDLPSLHRMNAKVSVALAELDLGTTVLEPLRPLRAQITLDSGVLSLTDIEARTAGGSFAGSTHLDSRSGVAAWRADLRWQGIELAGWIKGLRPGHAQTGARKPDSAPPPREPAAAPGKPAPVHAYATGELRGAANLTGRGQSTAQILASLDGNVRTIVRNGTLSHLVVELAGVDLAQALGVKLSGDRPLPMNCAVVALSARSGVLTTDAVLFDTPDSTLTAEGKIDLRTEQLDLRAVVHPKDFSPFSLRSPLQVKGPFTKPTVQLKRGPVAARVVAAAALATVNPFAALLPFIDPGDPHEAGCTEVAQRNIAEASRAASGPVKSRPKGPR